MIDILWEIVFICLAFCLGMLCGSIVVFFLKGGTKYSGVINVFKAPDKTTYSLELHHEAEKIEDMKSATFKVAPAVKVDVKHNPLD